MARRCKSHVLAFRKDTEGKDVMYCKNCDAPLRFINRRTGSKLGRLRRLVRP